MTGPVVFDPIRFPALTDACDGVKAFSDISTDVATDLAKLNDHFNPRPTRVYSIVVNQNGGPQNAFGTSVGWPNWADIVGGSFPASADYPTWTIPSTAIALLTLTSATLAAGNVAVTGAQIWHCWYLRGPGIRNLANNDHLGLLCSGIAPWNAGTRAYLYLAADINPGQQITLVPAAKYQNAGGTPTDNTRIGSSVFTVIALTGEPA
jgi:hypothetical protein